MTQNLQLYQFTERKYSISIIITALYRFIFVNIMLFIIFITIKSIKSHFIVKQIVYKLIFYYFIIIQLIKKLYKSILEASSLFFPARGEMKSLRLNLHYFKSMLCFSTHARKDRVALIEFYSIWEELLL